jgi:phospholipid/cholesterol/gamma-HCH transport system permease protein
MAQDVAKPSMEAAPAVPPPGDPSSGSWLNVPRLVALYFVEMLHLTAQTLSVTLQGRVALRDLVPQMASIGVDSAPIVMSIAAASGAVFALYISILALNIGLVEPVGGTLGYAFLNELGPVLGGVAFAARSGAAVAAEIGTMVVTEQVDALRAMAVSPVRYLVAPRVLAAILMLPLLTILADATGLLCGYVSAVLHGIPGATFEMSLYKYVRPTDLTNGLIKAVVFGYLIGLTACQQGLRTEGGATGVGRSTTRSVVLCVVLITFADLALAVLLNQAGRRR